MPREEWRGVEKCQHSDWEPCLSPCQVCPARSIRQERPSRSVVEARLSMPSSTATGFLCHGGNSPTVYARTSPTADSGPSTESLTGRLYRRLTSAVVHDRGRRPASVPGWRCRREQEAAAGTRQRRLPPAPVAGGFPPDSGRAADGSPSDTTELRPGVVNISRGQCLPKGCRNAAPRREQSHGAESMRRSYWFLFEGRCRPGEQVPVIR